MQAETGSRPLSHQPISIECHVTGHYKQPLPVLTVPLVSSGSSAWVQKASSHISSCPWMAGDSQGQGTTTSTNRGHCGMRVKHSISTLAASTVPSPSLKVQGISPHCATTGEPAPSPSRWEVYHKVREGETNEKCPSQQKHAVGGGERKLHCQVSSTSSSRWSKLKQTMQELFLVGAINSGILIFFSHFYFKSAAEAKACKKSKNINLLSLQSLIHSKLH